MARYIATPDLWNVETMAALQTGALRLQPGQWVRCGDQRPSRFYSVRLGSGHVTAFHGPRASAKLSAYVRAGKEGEARRAANRAARLGTG